MKEKISVTVKYTPSLIPTPYVVTESTTTEFNPGKQLSEEQIDRINARTNFNRVKIKG
jgi:hypothetical protein